MGNWTRAGLLLVAVLGVKADPGVITDAVASLHSNIQHIDHRIIVGVAVTMDKYQYQPTFGSLHQYLQSVTIPVVTEYQCQTAYFNGTTKRMICAGYMHGLFDSCQGDFGGPLVATVGGVTQLVGVVSFGFSWGLPFIPGVYARVSEFRDWIKTINPGV